MSRKQEGTGRRGLVLALAAVALVLSAGYAGAAPTAWLYDANSVAAFDPLSPAGLCSWEVDGKQYISQQWFWWRTGASGPEKPVDAASLDVPTGMPRLSDANGDGDNDMLFCRYLDKGGTFKIELTFLLIGGQMGSGTSDMAETIKICNTSALPIDFHFFQYVDFNLSASDTVWFPNANTVRQIGAGTEVAETVVVPVPPHREAALVPSTLTKLNDGGPTTLSDIAGPISGDVSWAFQWDMTLNPGQTLLISKDKNIVPEPATLALLGVGLGAMLLRRRAR